MNPTLLGLQPYPMVELQKRKAELKKKGIPLYDFGTGDPVEPTPEFIRHAFRESVPDISQYPTIAGGSMFRETVAAYIQRRFAVGLNPDTDILPSAGSKEAVFHLPMAFLDPNSPKDTVVYGSPGYPVYEAGTLFANGQRHCVTLTAEQGFRLELEDIDPEVLKRTAIVWINYPHNPTGAGVDLHYFKRQMAICNAYDILLASDECYADMRFHEDSDPHPSLLQAGNGKYLVVHSCSKRSGMTGYRSGFIAGDTTSIATYKRWRAAMGVGSSIMVEAAATAAWSDDQHVQQRRAIFSAKYNLLRQGLQQRGHRVLDSYGGLYLWAQVPEGFTSTSFAESCLEQSIVISPGGFFGPGGDGWFRLAVVPTLEDCQKALDRWPI